jgi:hypothetical protein
MHLPDHYDQLMTISLLPLEQVQIRPKWEASGSRQLFYFTHSFKFGQLGHLLQSLILSDNLDLIQQYNDLTPAKFDAPIQLTFQQRRRYKYQNLVVQPTRRSLLHSLQMGDLSITKRQIFP